MISFKCSSKPFCLDSKASLSCDIYFMNSMELFTARSAIQTIDLFMCLRVFVRLHTKPLVCWWRLWHFWNVPCGLWHEMKEEDVTGSFPSHCSQVNQTRLWEAGWGRKKWGKYDLSPDGWSGCESGYWAGRIWGVCLVVAWLSVSGILTADILMIMTG